MSRENTTRSLDSIDLAALRVSPSTPSCAAPFLSRSSLYFLNETEVRVATAGSGSGCRVEPSTECRSFIGFECVDSVAAEHGSSRQPLCARLESQLWQHASAQLPEKKLTRRCCHLTAELKSSELWRTLTNRSWSEFHFLCVYFMLMLAVLHTHGLTSCHCRMTMFFSSDPQWSDGDQQRFQINGDKSEIEIKIKAFLLF